jgi:hypothetical protein
MNAELRVSELMIEKFSADYPGLDVRQQIVMMQNWWAANPKRRKKNEYRFAVNWLNAAYAKACVRQFTPASPVYRDQDGQRYIITPERSRQYI